MQKRHFILSFFLLIILSFNVKALTIEEYINEWKDVAIYQMQEHKIPASITLAQGILESSSGNSPLAKNANNHFGIKCHGWTGKKYYQDDDAKDECFRKYDNAMQSYEDHSLFLVNRSRYAFLFNYEQTDYISWAKGLKQAGYATLPIYAEKLIELIERYQLNQFDQPQGLIAQEEIITVTTPEVNKENNQKIKKEEIKKEELQEQSSVQNSNIQVEVGVTTISSHNVYTNENKTKYVKANKHDTFYQIAKEFGINVNQMRKWNDFPKDKDLLTEGEKIYIMRKKTSLSKELKEIDLSTHTEPWRIAQEYGVQLQSLIQKNKSIISQYALNIE
ncbi:MAG: glucosaminidase domain-containing protein [Brumimicrobium sp.]|nr:glucosaminidase domain-containing protein [Brumimicrobium sp.]